MDVLGVTATNVSLAVHYMCILVVHAWNKIAKDLRGFICFSCLSRQRLNVNGVSLLFLFTDEEKKTFNIGIKFDIEFKSAYNVLENAETKKIVKRMEDGVSTFLCLETGIVFQK